MECFLFLKTTNSLDDLLNEHPINIDVHLVVVMASMNWSGFVYDGIKTGNEKKGCYKF